MIKIQYRYEDDKCECLQLNGTNDREKDYIATIHRIVQHYNNIQKLLEEMED